MDRGSQLGAILLRRLYRQIQRQRYAERSDLLDQGDRHRDRSTGGTHPARHGTRSCGLWTKQAGDKREDRTRQDQELPDRSFQRDGIGGEYGTGEPEEA